MINPQEGHILWDPYSATRGFDLRILWRNGIANSAISRPKEILVALIKMVFFERGEAMRIAPHFSHFSCRFHAALLGTLASSVSADLKGSQSGRF